VLDVTSRLYPQAAPELLQAARDMASPKYEALALGRLGRLAQAREVAARTGSDLLLGVVDDGPAGRAARERIIRRLPPALRATRARRAGRVMPAGGP
jgi:hypothetical protein